MSIQNSPGLDPLWAFFQNGSGSVAQELEKSNPLSQLTGSRFSFTPMIE
jgi:hypothetical protein